MIHASLSEQGQIFNGELPPGSTAYVDAEWVVAGSADAIPALVADPDGRLRWCDAPPVSLPEGLDVETAAGLALLAVARAATAAVGTSLPGRVEIVGAGIVARLVRALLSARRAGAGGVDSARPYAVVDTTGDPSRIEDATQRLADLGTLVLAGETLGRPLTLELYPDVHVRGLRVVGVKPPLQSGAIDHAGEVEESQLTILRSTLHVVPPGVTVSPGAGWYGVPFATSPDRDGHVPSSGLRPVSN